ncbi:MAG: prevent-host-death protein [Candidatus Pacebacteria bacterium CG_4_10_14_0_8_um_filter_42_14]|nr:MAG: prevent-host-death protein [Candidatus Pacebacteria bacterium CG_4_10_14_0_8_um_filter_42_14]
MSKSQFKPKALEYLRMVEEKKEKLVITHKGKPVVQVVPYEDESEKMRKKLGEEILEYVDPLEPVGLEDWDLLP